jgi:hypothetical protein
MITVQNVDLRIVKQEDFAAPTHSTIAFAEAA